MSDTIERFFEVLVQEIRENRPEYLQEPFTVAEIYQNLVPYRTHRDRIGVEMNGDYEHALLRLLGGEGGYLDLDSDVARRQIQDELEHPNPNTGLFRDFAAADVRLTEAHRELTGDVATEEPDAGSGEESEAGLFDEAEALAEDPGSEELPAGDEADSRRIFVMSGAGADDEVDVDPDPEFAAAPDDPTVHALGGGMESAPREPDAEISAGPDESGERVDDGTCHWCRADLPERNILNFCPYCGSDLRMKPCSECGEELESGWMFCPACGTEAVH